MHTEDHHSFDIHKPALLLASRSCMRRQKNVYAVAVDGVGLGNCRPGVSGIFLMTTIDSLCVTFLSRF